MLRRQFAAHREWMVRSYVVTFAFVFLRAMYLSPLFGGGAAPERMTALLWMSFVVPLLITEVFLQWGRSFGTPSVDTHHLQKPQRPKAPPAWTPICGGE